MTVGDDYVPLTYFIENLRETQTYSYSNGMNA